jgi:hypothetical protein
MRGPTRFDGHSVGGWLYGWADHLCRNQHQCSGGGGPCDHRVIQPLSEPYISARSRPFPLYVQNAGNPLQYWPKWELSEV